MRVFGTYYNKPVVVRVFQKRKLFKKMPKNQKKINKKGIFGI